ncbi:hypothetical protein BJV78DRAFT_246310 [Lactifluus subvellereus]|nr:hypothetical protein BJV78DRAFT_246310 [Lactifluus subvellereus]
MWAGLIEQNQTTKNDPYISVCMWNDPPQDRSAHSSTASRPNSHSLGAPIIHPTSSERILNLFFFAPCASSYRRWEARSKLKQQLVWYACLTLILPPSLMITIKGYTRKKKNWREQLATAPRVRSGSRLRTNCPGKKALPRLSSGPLDLGKGERGMNDRGLSSLAPRHICRMPSTCAVLGTGTDQLPYYTHLLSHLAHP